MRIYVQNIVGLRGKSQECHDRFWKVIRYSCSLNSLSFILMKRTISLEICFSIVLLRTILINHQDVLHYTDVWSKLKFFCTNHLKIWYLVEMWLFDILILVSCGRQSHSSCRYRFRKHHFLLCSDTEILPTVAMLFTEKKFIDMLYTKISSFSTFQNLIPYFLTFIHNYCGFPTKNLSASFLHLNWLIRSQF